MNTNMFGILLLYRVVKNINIIYSFVRGMFKTIMQSLKVLIFHYETYRIRNIMLKNIGSHNLDIIP